jgi:leader peptidase (prepilin peptidase)/N-methyltransferase
MDACRTGGCTLLDSLAYTLSPLSDGLARAVGNVSDGAPWFFPLAAGILGAAAASLVGVVVDRLPRIRGWNGHREPGLGLAVPASHCDSCGRKVPPLALIPVAGWFLAEGRCGGCGARVPWTYPAIEAGIGVASMAIVAVAGPGVVALALLLLLWGMLLVSWIDWNEHEIPDAATVPLLFLGLLLSPFEPDVTSRVLGALVSGGLMMAAFSITSSARKEDAMSLGDVALAGALGAWAGLCAAPAFLVCASLAYVAYAYPLRRTGQVWVPMGPGICGGLVLGVVTQRLMA